MLASAERSMGSDDAAEKLELNSLKREEGESSLLCVYIMGASFYIYIYICDFVDFCVSSVIDSRESWC